MHYRNRLDMTLVYDLLFNSEIFIWRKNGNWTRPYCLLAVENETCYVQFLSGLISFRNMFVKPYFWSKNTYDIKLDELEAPLPTLKIFYKFIEPAEPTVKRGQGRTQKHPKIKNPVTKNPVTENPVMENYLTSTGVPVKQPLFVDISVT